MDVHLERKIVTCRTLPSLPAVALEVVAVCRKDDLDLRDVTALLEKDPALAAKILRFANSTAVAASSKVTTLSRAIALLGTNTVLTVALSFSLVRGGGGGGSAALARFWRRALLCALGARVLAPERRLDPEELFLAGLLQDLGVLVLLEALPADYGELVAASGGDHARLVASERDRFGTDHAEVSAFLAARWNLPELVVETARGSHDPALAGGAASLAPAVACVHVAGLVAAVFDGGPAEAAAAAAARHLGLDATRLAGVLARVGEAIPQAEREFDVAVGPAADVDETLDHANEALALLSARAERMTGEATRAAEAIAAENLGLAERSTRDALTGLLNRAGLDGVVVAAFAAAVERGCPLTVAFCDIDHFKAVNDRHGHRAGDHVLAGVAQAIERAARPGDAVARWGGEEFVVVLPATDACAALEVAERVRCGVEAMRLEVGGAPLAVTISVGQATHDARSPFARPAALLEAADACLYEAKRSGRNRVVGRG